MKTLGTKQQIIIIFKQTCSMCKLPCELNLQKKYIQENNKEKTKRIFGKKLKIKKIKIKKILKKSQHNI